MESRFRYVMFNGRLHKVPVVKGGAPENSDGTSPNQPLTLTQEQLDGMCKAMDRLMSLPEAVQELQRQAAETQQRFGRMPMPKGPVIPGHRWAGTESDGDTEEARHMFGHWLLNIARMKSGQGLSPNAPDFVKRALSEGSTTAGGHLVPVEFLPELTRIIEERAQMRRLVRTVPMTRDKMDIPSLTSGMTVYWPGENQTITQGDPVFGKNTLDTKTMAALTSASMELDEDSAIALAGILAQLFGEAIADEEDRVILKGNADPFDGILFETGVNQVTMGTSLDAFADVTFQDVADLIDSITSRASSGARFFLHRNITNLLRKVRDVNHQYIWSPPTGSDPATIWGYPYTESDQMPSAADTAATTNFLAFGNPRYIYLGDRRQMTVAMSEHIGFKENELFWKVTERIAVAIAIPAAFGRLRTAA